MHFISKITHFTAQFCRQNYRQNFAVKCKCKMQNVKRKSTHFTRTPTLDFTAKSWTGFTFFSQKAKFCCKTQICKICTPNPECRGPDADRARAVQTLLSAQALIFVLGQAAGSARGRARPPTTKRCARHTFDVGRKEGPWPVGSARAPGVAGAHGSGAPKSPERDRIRDFPESPRGG